MAAVMEEKVHHNFPSTLLAGVLFIFAVFLLSILITFHPDDSGWTHSGISAKPHNLGGIFGAWLSDFSLSIFGFMAYFFPMMILGCVYLAYKQEKVHRNPLELSFRWLGLLITLVAGTILFYLHFPRLAIELPYGSSGILGQEAGDALLLILSESYATLLSLVILMTGISFFTHLSWLTLLGKVGKISLLSVGLLAYCYKLIQAGTQSRYADTNPTIQATAPSKKPQKKSAAKKPDKTPFKLNQLFQEKEKEEFNTPITYIASLPKLALLDKRKNKVKGYSKSDLTEIAHLVETVLADFNIAVKVTDIFPGPVITRFELSLAAGVKVSRISGLSKDIARGLSVTRVRIVEVIQGKSVIGLEIPNQEREMVSLNELLTAHQFSKATSPLSLALGKDIAGIPVVADLAKMPHVLVAGTTGSGKSVAINTMILSLLYKATPEQVRLIMIDPKMLELSVYEGIPHLLTPVVTDMKEASNSLRWAVGEMERRYKLMSKLGVRNLAGFNQKINDSQAQGRAILDPLFIVDAEHPEIPELTCLPNIVIVIDELADMMMIVGKKVEEFIARLAQKARAAGIHLILATQRPSVDVLTGLIKANVPTRISFQVSSKIDSRTILDQSGAETLLGNGDMLYLPSGTSIPIRAHGAFVSDDEVHRVVNFLKTTAPTNYIAEILQESNEPIPGLSSENSGDSESDALYDEAVAFVLESRKASISSVQRRFKVGYNRAARMIEDMEGAGIVSTPEHNGARVVLAPALAEN